MEMSSKKFKVSSESAVYDDSLGIGEYGTSGEYQC